VWAEKCWEDGLDLRRDQLGRGRRTAATVSKWRFEGERSNLQAIGKAAGSNCNDGEPIVMSLSLSLSIRASRTPGLRGRLGVELAPCVTTSGLLLLFVMMPSRSLRCGWKGIEIILTSGSGEDADQNRGVSGGNAG